jgi:hypothetical protein
MGLSYLENGTNINPTAMFMRRWEWELNHECGKSD